MPKLTVLYPSDNISEMNFNKATAHIFLAGTIDNGNSEDWQSDTILKFKEVVEQLGEDIVVLNPRRPNWNSDLKVNGDDLSPDFVHQVNWELDALEKCDIILMNLLADSKSPISLLELGLSAELNKLIVVCPKSFYRYGNIKILAERCDFQLLDSIDMFFDIIKHGIVELETSK